MEKKSKAEVAGEACLDVYFTSSGHFAGADSDSRHTQNPRKKTASQRAGALSAH